MKSFKDYLRPLANKLAHHFSSFWFTVYTKPKAFLRHKKERMMMKGISVSESNHQSFILFNTQKCASLYVNKLLATLAKAKKMEHIDFEAYFSKYDTDKYNLFDERNFMNNAFKKKGHYYGAFRNYYEIPELDRYKVLVMLRDPRDVLTSHYYSTAYSHEVINFKLLENRKMARSMTVDEFVLYMLPVFQKTYSLYYSNLLKPKSSNVILIKYEDMVKNFSSWIEEVSLHIGLHDEPAILQKLINEADFTVATEDVNLHKRRVKPGSYKEKLQAQTIDILNSELGDILEKLDYYI